MEYVGKIIGYGPSAPEKIKNWDDELMYRNYRIESYDPDMKEYVVGYYIADGCGKDGKVTIEEWMLTERIGDDIYEVRDEIKTKEVKKKRTSKPKTLFSFKDL